jgi:triosephosphate isomerase (TIM)
MVYLIGNWKSRETVTETKIWLEKFQSQNLSLHKNLEIVICMPFTDLAEANRLISLANLHLKTGAQDVSQFESGAHTGGITAHMLSELVHYCLVGHSERRRDTGEDCATVAEKTKLLLGAHITPIVCVDTPYLEEQVKSIFELNLPINNCLFAYEPIDAIGTGQPATPENIETVAAKIAFLTDSACPILYGGSITKDNLNSYIDLPNISGFLVGGSSLDPEHFANLITQIS